MRGARGAADALRLGAAAIGLAAAAVGLGRPGADVVPVAPRVPPMPAPIAAVPRADGLAARVVAANPFHASRTAPGVRWSPPDAEAVTTGGGASFVPAPDPWPAYRPADEAPPVLPALPGLPLPPDRPPTRRAPRVPALFGTVIGTDGARALLRLDASIAAAQLYDEGARAGGWRVVRVEPDHVLLDGPHGLVTLSLPRASAPRLAAPRPTDGG